MLRVFFGKRGSCQLRVILVVTVCAAMINLAIVMLLWRGGGLLRILRRALPAAHRPPNIIRVGDPLADGKFSKPDWEYMQVRMPYTRLVLDVVKRHKNRDVEANWKAAEESRWELHTLRAFNQEIGPNTTYVGFGEWIGVTGLFAAQKAHTTIMIDPDPISFPMLRENVNLNRERLGNRIALDNRCIMDKHAEMEMVADGYSCSSLLKTPDCGSWGQRKVLVQCLPLPALLQEHGVDTSGSLFVKIDTEGAEAFILPSLQAWIVAAAVKPTLFVSMHNRSDDRQKGAIAAIFNTYKYYAVLGGEHVPAGQAQESLKNVAKECHRGVPLSRVGREGSGGGFSSETICGWCDYLITDDNRPSERICGQRTSA